MLLYIQLLMIWCVTMLNGHSLSYLSRLSDYVSKKTQTRSTLYYQRWRSIVVGVRRRSLHAEDATLLCRVLSYLGFAYGVVPVWQLLHSTGLTHTILLSLTPVYFVYVWMGGQATIKEIDIEHRWKNVYRILDDDE